MRIATYNVEWFNALFDDDGNMLDDKGWSGRHDVRRTDQLAALGIVFTALNADAVMVIEAPDHNGRRATVAALENFASAFDLRARKAVMGFPNDTQQEIALLFDPDTMQAQHDPLGDPTGKKGHTDSPRFDGVFRIDLDIDATEDLVRFSKPPLELAVQTVSGRSLRMIGAHLKSKAPHGAHDRDEVMRIAIANRRKQLAQAIWLRQRVDELLARGDSLMVLGDLNDGPGLDEYENLFGRSSVEIVMGQDGQAELYDPHARRALQHGLGGTPTSARFYLGSENRYLQALLDYIMISDDMRALAPRWRIWHPFDDPVCWKTPELRDALVMASDHFPVSVDIGL
ncbi:endonuclease/exonuclease/phosphatase family protein [Lutimaribacter sp. EGI FJ00015]|uniref:Endonuclease/exonuclease/phosphatase family protein n=1 Tax=Lutimaribacter degradans TaxID=2945989 RepID=A0ACC6A0E8_9RHOB|nr:endonuclease/exonuclease/phosphatase family protein [Lutimaribacter sp. EGI FJ00013]MCM2563821.1 endonuclease/exonuclease/phosphatase family protein [Lutimaribacter sp. EGI FJ00013]MCO0615024.1 endonuclease/exonuclease/phosphatase family protein [Lutimaribacter sp. EGI FJ00015]MCO0637688.1 endonuclease/exonuclease/phosphatase family protein [Lutimaribacter sp. EGI FJ00014]